MSFQEVNRGDPNGAVIISADNDALDQYLMFYNVLREMGYQVVVDQETQDQTKFRRVWIDQKEYKKVSDLSKHWGHHRYSILFGLTRYGHPDPIRSALADPDFFKNTNCIRRERALMRRCLRTAYLRSDNNKAANRMRVPFFTAEGLEIIIYKQIEGIIGQYPELSPIKNHLGHPPGV